MGKKSYDDLDAFHEHGIHIPSRTIKLDLDIIDTGEDLDHTLGSGAASKLIKNLHILSTISSEPITIIMNCPGGNVVDGWAMFDAIRSTKSHITIDVLGEASSMGAIVLQSADVRRVYPFTRLLLHDGWVGASGNASDVEANIEVSKLDRYRTYEILAKRTGKTKAYWSRKMAKDYTVSAEQALDEGLIDEIIGVEI